MADARGPLRRRQSATLFSGVAVGVLAASGGVAAPAFAAPDYPSWAEIEAAKGDEAATQAEIDRVSELLAGLQDAADAAVRDAQVAAEAFHLAQDELDAALAREAELAAQADEAEARAEISKMRAGLLVAHLARTAGTDLSLQLVLSGADAETLLDELGRASKVGEQSQLVYDEAVADRNTADALTAEAADAAAERERLATAAEARADEAEAAAVAAQAAVDEQEQRSVELYAQLASLKDTTAALERERAEGQRQEAAELALREQVAREQAAREAAEQAAREQAEADADADSGADADADSGAAGSGSSSGSSSGGSSSGSSGGSSGASGGSTPTPTPQPEPAPAAPNTTAVETAIAYARAQLGERYQLGGAGPDVWDCSGLTLMSYRAAGIAIGTHSATNQYATLASRGKAVPLSQVQRGDLLFWGVPGNYYHVAIYLGGGRIIEAPNPTKPVREYYIWGSPSAAARPAG
ncbi:C40 family peptidase [Agromyces sp. SYSU T00194]|uniref:C40 family peptidase n=1 Tax=Agromyces chitinivorans TaxID=3158560 RepID=UPI0033931837